MANGFGNRHDMFNNNNAGQIACRLCNRIFTSTQSLLTHIESHMEHEENAIRRLYSPELISSQRQQLPPHRFSLGFSLPIAPPTQSPIANISQPRRNPFVSVGQVGSSQSIRPVQFPSYAGNNNINNNNNNINNNVGGGGLLAQFPSPQIYQWKAEEESSSDGTKAYILQLEKPIKKIDFIDLVNNDDDQKLDLELRL